MLALPANGTTTTPTFGQPVPIFLSSGYGEPSIAAAPDGTLYVAAPGSHTSVWRSDDGGAHWTRAASSLGASGDSDITVDADGVVYASDLFNNDPVSASFDKAASFSYSTPSNSGASLDRQWTSAFGHGTVWSAIRDGSTERVSVSHDQARTWKHTVAATGVGLQGDIIALNETTAILPYEDGNVHLLITHDDGDHWQKLGNLPLVSGAKLFPAAAVDAAGTFYLAWAEGGPCSTYCLLKAPRVVVSESRDGGASWSAPQVVSRPGTFDVFPWLSADAAGHVAVSWFEGVPPAGLAPTDSNYAALTQWTVRVAYSFNANTAAPTWTSTPATGVLHTGPICTSGTGCSPVANPVYGNRMLLDFFETAERPDGSLIIAYSGDQSPGNAASNAAQLYVVAQDGGPNLK